MAQLATRDSIGGIDGNYATTLPDITQLRQRLLTVLEYWSSRNEIIRRVRNMMAGKNNIPVPKNSMYKPRIVRSYLLAGTINEKRARFLSIPEVAVIPEGIGIAHQTKATNIERALNEAMQIIDANGKNDAWDKAVLDAILLDEGIELIERAPAAFWPELIVNESTGKTKLEMLFEDPEAFAKAREEYKKVAGLPIRATYVPLENFFPVWEGHTMVEAFHIEYRSLRAVIGNRSFDMETRRILADIASQSRDGGLSTKVTIVRYANQWWYAYYVLTPSSSDMRTKDRFPDPILSYSDVGQPMLLYAYEHELGRVPYNSVPGRYGGWRSDKNAIEPFINALVELNQAADTLISQIATNIGARYWPNLKVTLNPEFRGSTSTREVRAPQLNDGEPYVMYVGESIEPIFTPAADPMAQWLYAELVKQFQLISGSRAIYGMREPGVDNGYQYNLQITQSEHLDEKIEVNLAEAVKSRCELIISHIKAIDEPVYVAVGDQKEGKKYTSYIALDPKDLYPTPRIDARVRKPKPIDFLTSLRAARDASADRRGSGTPLLSDDTIYEMILNIKEPDVEKRKIWLQNEMQKLFDSGFISEKITERLNMKFFQDGPPLSPAAESADSALVAAAQQGLDIMQQQGGISPQVGDALNSIANNQMPQPMQPPPTPADRFTGNQQPSDSGVRRVGGVPPGNPQYEQVIANAIKNGMMGGRLS